MSLKITVNNVAAIPNKHIRKLKWNLYNLAEKFNHLIYAVIHVNMEGHGTPIYELSLQIGVAGPDVIIKNESTNLEQLVARSYKAAHRYCRKSKPHR